MLVLRKPHDRSPVHPLLMNWHKHYPQFYRADGTFAGDPRQVEFADVGCGYGGLLGASLL